MSLQFTKIRYKNFLSTGNTWTEIQLNKNKTTLIVGENGSGKSTVLDAITFALYGKPFRKINKPQLMNSINQRDLSVEIEFNTLGSTYLIRRGLKPGVFEIWKNGVLVNQDASSRDYQSFFEENILKMNFKSFSQTVILGSSTYVPFMQLSAQHRREVIEDLLDLQVFSTMSSLLKESISNNKDKLVSSKYDIDLIENKIHTTKEYNKRLQNIQNKNLENLRLKIKELEEENLQFTNTASQYRNELEPLIKKVSVKASLQKNHKKVDKLKSDLESKLREVTHSISFYHDNDNCPTCKQSIDTEFKSLTVEKKQQRAQEIESALEQLEVKITEIDSELQALTITEKEVSEQETKIRQLDMQIDINTRNIGRIQDELNREIKTVESVSEDIPALELEMKNAQKRHEELTEEREVLAASSTILKDGGIKTKIIKRYIPKMNKLINRYLSMMDFFVDFQLDEEFNEKILSRHRDEFSYSSFSEGEKKRIDLSLMMTWRAISKMRNSVSTNLLIMDEVLDSSLDNIGTEEFLKILSEVSDDTNVFIISHKGDTILEKFENVVRFEKVKDFSQIQQG